MDAINPFYARVGNQEGERDSAVRTAEPAMPDRTLLAGVALLAIAMLGALGVLQLLLTQKQNVGTAEVQTLAPLVERLVDHVISRDRAVREGERSEVPRKIANSTGEFAKSTADTRAVERSPSTMISAAIGHAVAADKPHEREFDSSVEVRAALNTMVSQFSAQSAQQSVTMQLTILTLEKCLKLAETLQGQLDGMNLRAGQNSAELDHLKKAIAGVEIATSNPDALRARAAQIDAARKR